MFRRPTLWIWIGVLLLAAIGVALFAAAAQSPAQAQPAQDDLAALLDELWNRVLTEQTSATTSDFTFTISFHQSISGTGNSVTFGQGLNSLRLDRVGADFFCLSRAFSRNLNIECIPFSNISRVSYQQPAAS
jgi:hypothetical protein